MGVLERVRESATDAEAVASPIGGEVSAAVAAPVEVRAALKRALVDRLGLREMASLVSSGDVARARDELSVACVAAINAGEVAGAGRLMSRRSSAK